jgi:tRNA(Arg) A34 adenosine deaminase TadA
MDDSELMGQCIDLARAAAARGNPPYGSIIVLDGRIVAEGENDVVTGLDPTGHAEIVAIRLACRSLGRLDLSGATIYASGEPCWTCSSAIRWARLSRVVVGARSFSATGGYTSEFPILRVDGLAGIGPPPDVVVGVLEERVLALFAEVGWPRSER